MSKNTEKKLLEASTITGQRQKKHQGCLDLNYQKTNHSKYPEDWLLGKN